MKKGMQSLFKVTNEMIEQTVNHLVFVKETSPEFSEHVNSVITALHACADAVDAFKDGVHWYDTQIDQYTKIGNDMWQFIKDHNLQSEFKEYVNKDPLPF